MIAFANDMGGVLLFGVSDQGEIIGCDFDQIQRCVMTFARNGAEPSLQSLVRVEREVHQDKVLARVYIAPGSDVPYRFKGKVFHEGGVYIRMGNQTVAANLDEVFSLIRRGDPRQWETQPSARQRLSFDSAEEICEDHGVPFSQDHFLGLGIVNSERLYTNLGYLLSDQNPFSMIFNRVDSQGKLIEGYREEGSLLAQMRRLRRTLDEVNRPYINKDTGKQEREDIYPWPVIAVREALTNSLAHRDYSSPVCSAINISPHNINFLTVGGLPPELPLAQATKMGVSFCRNQRLAQLFQRLGWMELIGSGFGDIARAYRPYNIEPRFEAQGRFFTIDLPRVYTLRHTRTDTVMDFLVDAPGGLARSEIETQLGVSRPTVSKVLQELEDEHRIVRKGNGRSTRYFAL